MAISLSLKKGVGLLTFLKGSSDPRRRMPGCANHHNSKCIANGNDCAVVQGKRCNHFERVILPTAQDIGQKDSIYSQYEKQAGIGKRKQLARGEIRSCPGCGAELGRRRRFCDECRRKRRQKTQRENMKRHRLQKAG